MKWIDRCHQNSNTHLAHLGLAAFRTGATAKHAFDGQPDRSKFAISFQVMVAFSSPTSHSELAVCSATWRDREQWKKSLRADRSSAETRLQFQLKPPRYLGVQSQLPRNFGVGFEWRNWSGTDGLASNSWVTWPRSTTSGVGLQLRSSYALTDAMRAYRLKSDRMGCAYPLRVVHQSGPVQNALLALISFPPPARG
jgi:hypothetical protein